MKTLLQQNGQDKQQDSQKEEDYERMYAKMARDFVHIDDLKDFIDKLRIAIGPAGLALPGLTNDQAISRGLDYKEIVENGEDGTAHYSDIVTFDDGDEEAEAETEEEEEE